MSIMSCIDGLQSHYMILYDGQPVCIHQRCQQVPKHFLPLNSSKTIHTPPLHNTKSLGVVVWTQYQLYILFHKYTQFMYRCIKVRNYSYYSRIYPIHFCG